MVVNDIDLDIIRPNNNENRILLTTYIGKNIMTKLNPETAQQIADLFTSVTVSRLMANDDAKNAAYWMASEYKTIIELADTFGIFLPAYDLAVSNLEKPVFKDAILTVDKI